MNVPTEDGKRQVQQAIDTMAAHKVDYSQPVDLSPLGAQCALVTGGANGIGAECVRELAKNGCVVVIADIDVEKGEVLAKSLCEQQNKVIFVKTDVEDHQSQHQAFEKAALLSSEHRIDIVVICAGLAGDAFQHPSGRDGNRSPTAPAEMLPEPSMRAIQINQMGAFKTIQLAFESFWSSGSAASPQGSLILMGSMAGYTDLRNRPDYGASKFGVRGLFRALRGETAAACFARINLVAPTFVRSALTADIVGGLEKAGVQFADVSDVTAAVLRFAVDKNINGRAAGVGAYGVFDLRDDLEGADGSFEMRKYYETGAMGLFLPR